MSDQINVSTVYGRFTTQLLGAFSELEHSIIKERICAGLKEAKRKGIKLGRKKTRPSQMIRKLYGEGLSYRRIAEILGISHQSVYREVQELKCN